MTSNWREMSVSDAWIMSKSRRPVLYMSQRGNQVLDIDRVGGWYKVSLSSGGIRHLKAGQVLYFKVEDK